MEIIKEGIIRRHDGTILQGTFDFKDGFDIIKEGIIRGPDGTMLQGTFDFKDRFEIIKEGTITRPDGTILKGTFINNTLNGDGEKIIFLKDNQYQYIYKGLFKDNSLINGVLTITNNFYSYIYEGTFEFINGRDVLKKGTIRKPDGTILNGTFDFKDGFELIKEGTMTSPDGTILNGTFDFKDGFELIKEGTITRPNGTILKGTFINNNLNGDGEKIIFYKDNPYQYIYKGLFKDNNLIQGAVTNNFNSDIYEGTFEFINGRDVLKEGKLIKSNGKIYEGTFDYKLSDVKITTKDKETYFIRPHNGEIYRLTSFAKQQSQTPTLKI
jgi:hypothetical protein